MPTAAILLSRQSKHPHGGLPWVQKAVAAVKFAGQNGYTVLTSTGMSTWELTLAYSRISGISVKVILDGATDGLPQAAHDLRFQFDLDEDTEIRCSGELKATGNDALQVRDAAIVTEADLLLPISVRDGGHMAALINQAVAGGKNVNWTFQIPYAARTQRLAYTVPTHSLSAEAERVSGEYLTHWTRASAGRWPDERAIDYYAAIVDSDRYPRTAFDTLGHIVASRQLRASSRHMPRNTATVAFTSLPIREILPLMRWRAKYAEMAFEPYGIGIHRDLAKSLGIYPVQYYDQNFAYPECSVEPWLTQSIGMKTDWRQESEFRHKGDLLLRQIRDDALIAFCPSQKEAAALESAAGIRTIALFE